MERRDWRESRGAGSHHIGQFELMMSGCMGAAALQQVMRAGSGMIGWEVWRRWLFPCFGGVFEGLDFLLKFLGCYT
jgi:hypothetical protein